MTTHSPAVTYCNLMEEIKRRLELVERFTTGSIQLGSEQFAYECVSVQLRKVLELIAFGSLCANKDKYAEVHANFAKHWKAKALLRDLEAVHSHFYPAPVRLSHTDADGVKQFARIEEGVLTPDEFVVLYDKCSEVIHTRNPFSESEPRIDFVRSLAEWVQRIQQLLKLHLLLLVGAPEVWVISMSEPSDGRVHAYIAGASVAG